MDRMMFLLACIRERLKGESREYYKRHGNGCPPDWLQKTIAAPMHHALGMACHSQSVSNVVRLVKQSYRNWWKRPDHFRAPAPRPPERYPSSIYVNGQCLETKGNSRVRLLGNKVGWMHMRGGDPPTGRPYRGTITRSGGKWFLSIVYECGPAQYVAPETEAVGVDMGLKTLATVYDGDNYTEYPASKEGRRQERKIAKLNKKIARTGMTCYDCDVVIKLKAMQALRQANKRKAPCGHWLGRYRHSKRYDRLCAAKRRIHRKTANRRRDAHHKATTAIVAQAARIGLEDLNVKGCSATRNSLTP